MCEWVDISKALMTPLVAIIAVYIAYQQWQTNRNKLKHELFDRRFELYAMTNNVLFYVLAKGSVPGDYLAEFSQASHKSDFLLDESFTSLFSEIVKKYNEFRALSEELEAIQDEGARKKNVEKQREIKNWMEDQAKNIKIKFAKYLKIDG